MSGAIRVALRALGANKLRTTLTMLGIIIGVGAVIALMTLGSAIRRKGLFGGALDTALDFTPVVGTMKNMAEVGRGPHSPDA